MSRSSHAGASRLNPKKHIQYTHIVPGLIDVRTNIVSKDCTQINKVSLNLEFGAHDLDSDWAGFGLVTSPYSDRGSVWGKKDRGRMGADASHALCVFICFPRVWLSRVIACSERLWTDHRPGWLLVGIA